MEFDRNRRNLREQLLQTIDSIEYYLHQQSSNEFDGNINLTKKNETDDQIFFYHMIEKMMKLIVSMDYDVFQLISMEITNCLITISKKFFLNERSELIL